MGDFNEILKAAIDGGESLESAMRKAASLAAKEAVESLLKTEITSLPGYDRHEYSGRNSGDSRNGICQRTIQTSLGPITIDVPRDGNGRYEPIAIPKYKRKADLIVSTVLKLHSSGMADEEMRLFFVQKKRIVENLHLFYMFFLSKKFIRKSQLFSFCPHKTVIVTPSLQVQFQFVFQVEGCALISQ